MLVYLKMVTAFLTKNRVQKMTSKITHIILVKVLQTNELKTLSKL